jgi:hypothetical protein
MRRTAIRYVICYYRWNSRSQLAAGEAVSSQLAIGRAVGVYCNSSTVLVTGSGSQAYWRKVLLTGYSSIGILVQSLLI